MPPLTSSIDALLMNAYTNTLLKCERFEVSHFHDRSVHLCTNKTWRSNNVPAFRGTSHLNRRVMASMAAEFAFVRNGSTATTTAAAAAAILFSSNWKASERKSHQSLHTHCMDDKNRVSKQLAWTMLMLRPMRLLALVIQHFLLHPQQSSTPNQSKMLGPGLGGKGNGMLRKGIHKGLFSLKKKIEDTVLRAEMLAPLALELEEARRNKQEQQIRDYNLWDDTAKSSEILAKLADSAKVVDALKDLTYKAEEAKLITQLAEIDAIHYGLFRQAYVASLDVSKLLDQYEMSKLLKGPYDMEGACLVIKAGGEGYPEVWVKQLLSMYTKWAKRLGYKGRVIEKRPSTNGGIKSATIEFEFEFAYGYLSGETGVHNIISSQNGSALHLASSASVDVFPLFLGKAHDLQIDEEDLVIALPSMLEEEQGQTGPSVSIQHIPTGVTAQSSGERSHFANKIKAINRLKGKLLILALEQGVTEVSDIKKDDIANLWQKETRTYMYHPHKLVKDVKTGIQLPDLMSVLNGNLEPLIGAHINSRQ